MKGELFDVSFNPLTCVLKKPLHMAQDIYDVKHQVKRCLLEIKDWADRDVFLSWSGGFDGAFTVLAFLDLVDEGKLPIDAFQIKGANFQSKGRSASSDWDRGVKFLQEIQRPGMRIDLQDIELDKIFMKKAVDVCFKFDQVSFGWAIQEAWRRDQDNICLLHMGFPFPTYKKDVLVEFNTFNFCEVMDNSESVNIYQWDEHIFSSFFTDFLLEVPYVDYNPDHHYDEYLWWAMSSQVHKFMYFLMCYPILMKLFLKNLTVKSWLIEDEDIKMLWQRGQQRLRFQVTKEHGHCEVILPNGEVVKSIEHSQQFFNGHS